jgi:hypothetical protein
MSYQITSRLTMKHWLFATTLKLTRFCQQDVGAAVSAGQSTDSIPTTSRLVSASPTR